MATVGESGESPQSVRMGPGKTCLVPALLFGVLPLLAYAGWPVSGYALGYTLAFVLLASAHQAVEQARDARHKALAHRLKLGSLASARNQAKWFAIGLALVWLLQVVLNVVPAPQAETVGAGQLALVDTVEWARTLTTPLNFAMISLAALAVAILVGALWPIGLMVLARRWLGRLVGVLVPMTTFAFVGVGPVDTFYDGTRQQIRAQLVDGDQSIARQLAQARSDMITWHWLAATARQSDDALRRLQPAYITAPLAQCRQFQQQALAAYRASGGAAADTQSFCNQADMRDALAENLLPRGDRPAPLFLDSRLFDFPAVQANLLTGAGHRWSVDPALGLRDLIDLRQRMVRQLNDAKVARNTLRHATSTLMHDALAQFTPPAAEALTNDLVKALSDRFARFGAPKFRAWLDNSALGRNGAVRALLGDPAGQRLTVPGHGDAAAGLEVLHEQLRQSGTDPQSAARIRQRENEQMPAKRSQHGEPDAVSPEGEPHPRAIHAP